MPDRDLRGWNPVRVGLATGAIVAISLTVSASLAAPRASAQDQPAQAEPTTPGADAAPPADPASVPASPEVAPPAPSEGTTESSEPAAGSAPAKEPPSQSGAAPAGGSPKPAQGPAEPARPAEPVSDTVDPPGETAALGEDDAGANGSIVAITGDAELAPEKRPPAETVTRSPAADTRAGPPPDANPRRAASDALGPDPVELRIRTSRPTARPRVEEAHRRADGAPRNLPVRMPRAPDSGVCGASSACAAGPLGMMPALAALGCLCALIFERLLQVLDRWRPHRFVSLRERPG
jgi:hypothetical protein